MFDFIDLGNGLINVVAAARHPRRARRHPRVRPFRRRAARRRQGPRVRHRLPAARRDLLHATRSTVYTLNWLPIGGFVRLEGEEGESDDPRAFVNQRLRTRLVILLAGVAMNFLLAWVIFTGIAVLADPVATVRIGSVAAGIARPQSVGLMGGQPDRRRTRRATRLYDNSGDVIIAIDGQRFLAVRRHRPGDAPLRYLRAARRPAGDADRPARRRHDADSAGHAACPGRPESGRAGHHHQPELRSGKQIAHDLLDGDRARASGARSTRRR